MIENINKLSNKYAILRKSKSNNNYESKKNFLIFKR